MFLKAIELSRTLPCLAEPGKIIVIGKPDRSLADVIPFLAALPGVIAYHPGTCSLTFRRQPGFLTLNPEAVYITQVKDVEEGLTLIAALKDAINAAWEQRDAIKPAVAAQRAPRHLDIYALLPQTNCKLCGEATCLAFAVNLILNQRLPEECPPLQSDEAFRERKTLLDTMIT